MKTAILIILTFHGLIHLFGFMKAIYLTPISRLTQVITKTNGMLWLTASVLFIVTAILIIIDSDYWWIFSSLSIVISQYLIITSWHDARFGTIVNVILIIATIIGYSTWSFSSWYHDDVQKGLQETYGLSDTILTENDLLPLPKPVKKYLHYTGVVGKPKVRNFKVVFCGQIRKNEESEWMSFSSEQYNFINTSIRLFFMKATMKYLPVEGYHCFKNGNAFMDIRLFSLFKVQYESGKEMGIAETVTFFNDMCCMAPATLIDKRIKWLETGTAKVKAQFTNNGITISAWLYFNEKGELTNFISDDRFAFTDDNTMKQLRWSTPLKDYKQFNGITLASNANAVYSYPLHDLTYGNFRLTSIEYNCKEVTDP
ncbi:MAG: hypothetical protein HYZ42_02165 [Bacteroidetes bacterium]|nr:hypothetical protein [Bacteroidota bacterium]